MPVYPDISDFLAREERGRRARAKLSFVEKLEILDRLQEAADFFRTVRRERTARAKQLENA